MKKRIVAWSIACMMALLAFPFHAGADAPQQAIEAQVNRVLDVLRDPALKDESAKQAKEEKVLAIINGIFDYTELSRRTLSRNWDKLNADQQGEFQDLFSKLLRNVYMDRILAYRDEKVVFQKETVLSPERVEVKSKVLTATAEIPMHYRMIKKNGAWKVYDVVIEGVSMVNNYRSQFNQILTKNSPEEMLKILRKKVDEA